VREVGTKEYPHNNLKLFVNFIGIRVLKRPKSNKVFADVHHSHSFFDVSGVGTNFRSFFIDSVDNIFDCCHKSKFKCTN